MTISNNPFIKKFQTRNNYYIYDVNTNKIFQVDNIIFNIIEEVGLKNVKNINKKYPEYPASEIAKKHEEIEKFRKEFNCYSSHRPNISFGINSADELKTIYQSSGLFHLVLELTEKCNLRCKYCVYSGRYSKRRIHGSKDMSFETGKKAVDYFFDMNNGNPSIGFYGGEPLLRIDIIKKIVNYATTKSKYCTFNMTTNGTLFTDEIIQFVVNNRISVLISLDGPKEFHDRYRIHKNGKGSHEKIIQNIKKIKKYSSTFFEDNVGFTPVLSPPYDFEAITKFFSGDFFNVNAKKNENKIIYSFVDTHETSFFKDFKLAEFENSKYRLMAELRHKYLNSLVNNCYNDLTIEKRLFNKEFLRIDQRPTDIIGDNYPPQGTCIPGQRKLFVDVDGRLFMCERVDRNVIIGSVDKGLCYEKIYNFLTKYEKFFEDCKDCWAQRLCMKCYNSIKGGELLSIERKEQLCRNSLISIERDMIDYCETRERNIDAFKPFEFIHSI